MKDNYCVLCGHLQQFAGEGDFYCERCGAHNNGCGGCEYDGSREGIKEMDERVKDHDQCAYNAGLDAESYYADCDNIGNYA